MITITLTIKDTTEGTTEIDCTVVPLEPTNSEAGVANVINTAARVAFEDHLKANPGGGQIIQRLRKGGPNERGIKPSGL